jgi:acyl-CoA reductase-like NAD-dependent aldehyde dehydrogenase
LHDRSILRDAGLVAGQWRHQSRSQATFDVTDPATGDLIARLPDRMVRRRGQAHLWRNHPRPSARQAHHGDQAADRRRGLDHAVEFPQRDDRPQGRPGAGRRLRLCRPPAAETPLSALALAVLAERAGMPPGLFSVITSKRSSDIGKEFCENPLIRKLTFTGSTEVGRILLRQAADQVLKCSMELGGNAPFIVFDDADLDGGRRAR